MMDCVPPVKKIPSKPLDEVNELPFKLIEPLPVLVITIPGEKPDLIPAPVVAVPFMVMLPPAVRLNWPKVSSSIPFHAPVVFPVIFTPPTPVLI